MIYVIYCIILPYASFNDSRTNLRISARSFPFHPGPRNTKILGVSHFTQSAFPSSHIDFMKFSGIFNLPFAILTLFPLPPTTGPGMPPSSSTLPSPPGELRIWSRGDSGRPVRTPKGETKDQCCNISMKMDSGGKNLWRQTSISDSPVFVR